MWDARFDREKNLLQTDINLPVPVSLIKLVGRAAYDRVRVVVHDVDPVELADRIARQCLPVTEGGNVAVLVARCTAGALNLVRDVGSRGVLDICKNDACALGRKKSSGGLTNSAGCAGDDRYLVGESRGPVLLRKAPRPGSHARRRPHQPRHAAAARNHRSAPSSELAWALRR